MSNGQVNLQDAARFSMDEFQLQVQDGLSKSNVRYLVLVWAKYGMAGKYVPPSSNRMWSDPSVTGNESY